MSAVRRPDVPHYASAPSQRQCVAFNALKTNEEGIAAGTTVATSDVHNINLRLAATSTATINAIIFGSRVVCRIGPARAGEFRFYPALADVGETVPRRRDNARFALCRHKPNGFYMCPVNAAFLNQSITAGGQPDLR